MDRFPIRMFSRPGRNSSTRLKILRDPLKIFSDHSRVFIPVKKKYAEDRKKLDLTEILNLSTKSNKKDKLAPLSPTSSFLAPSRDKWYNPYINRDIRNLSHSPTASQNKNTIKNTLPIIHKILRIQS